MAYLKQKLMSVAKKRHLNFKLKFLSVPVDFYTAHHG